MNRKSLRIIASAVLFGTTVFGSVAAAAPAGVESLNAIVTRVQSDVDLTGKYAQHFNLKAERVAPYIQALEPISLDKDVLFNVFSVQDGTARVEKYLAGEIVFVDVNLRPILDSYGNPLIKPGDPVLDVNLLKQDDDEDDDGGAMVAGAASVSLGALATAAIGTAAIVYAADQNRSDTNNPVPEPASLAVMSASIAMFAAARRKRNK